MKLQAKTFNRILQEFFDQLTSLSHGTVVAGYRIVGLILLHFPFIGLLLLVALLPGEELTALIAGRTFVWVLGVVTFAVWFIQVLLFGKKVRLAKMPTALMFLWFLWGFASTLWASEQSIALNRSLDVAQGAAFVILLQNLIKDGRRLNLVLFTYFFATVFFSLIAIESGLSEGVKRITLTEAQNPNALARALGIGFLLTPYLFSQLKLTPSKLLTVLGSGSLLFAIFMTGSRGAWAALIAAVGLTWWISRRNFVRIRSLVGLIGLIVVGISLLNYYGVTSEWIVRRLSTLASPEQTVESARVYIWRVGWEMVKAHPMTGVGLQNFPTRFEDYIETAGVAGGLGIYPGRDPHSIFFSVVAELGLVGLVIFVALLWAIVLRLLPHKDDRRGICGLLLALFMIFSGIPATIQYRKFFWLALGLAMLIPMVIRNGKDSSARSLPHVS
jgi:O-antigen ligase